MCNACSSTDKSCSGCKRAMATPRVRVAIAQTTGVITERAAERRKRMIKVVSDAVEFKK